MEKNTELSTHESTVLSANKPYLVYQSNSLIQNRRHMKNCECTLNETQFKLINLMISLIKKDTQSMEWCNISMHAFLKRIHACISSAAYENLKSLTIDLFTKYYCIETEDKKLHLIHLLADDCVIDQEKHILHLKFSDKLMPFLLSLKDNYDAYYFDMIALLKGKYTCRLYEYLSSFKYLNTPYYISIEKFSEIITDNKYTSITDIRRKVFLGAIEEINKITDLNISFKEMKKKGKNGRDKVKGFTFYIKQKSEQTIKSLLEDSGYDMEDVPIVVQKGNLPF